MHGVRDSAYWVVDSVESQEDRASGRMQLQLLKASCTGGVTDRSAVLTREVSGDSSIGLHLYGCL